MDVAPSARVSFLTQLTAGLSGVIAALQAKRPLEWIAESPEARGLQGVDVNQLSKLLPGACDPISRIWSETGCNQWKLDLGNGRLAEYALELHGLAYASLLLESDEVVILSDYHSLFPDFP